MTKPYVFVAITVNFINEYVIAIRFNRLIKAL